MIQLVTLVAVGGAFGSISRFLVVRAIQDALGGPLFPAGTLAVNAVGCFLIGFIAGLVEVRSGFSPEARALLVTGFLGGFTTFSAFGVETFQMMRADQALLAGLYVVASVGCGLLAVWAGDAFGRML